MEDFKNSKKILLDNFVLDLENKTLTQCDSYWYYDSFVDAFENIEEIVLSKNEENRTIKLVISTVGDEKPAIIEVNEKNEIVKYINENIVEIGNGFLRNNDNLEELNIPNVKVIGHDFLMNNNALKELNFPNLEKAGIRFLHFNNSVKVFNVPKLTDSWLTEICEGVQLHRKGTVSNREIIEQDMKAHPNWKGPDPVAMELAKKKKQHQKDYDEEER